MIDGPAMILLGLGLVLTLEGLVLALAPSRLEAALAFLLRLPVETRRRLGLLALALGVVVIWLAKGLAG